MNTKHPNLDKIISQLKIKNNELRALVGEYDTLKLRQRSGNNADEQLRENRIKISTYLVALAESGFIDIDLWLDATSENSALYEEAFWAHEEVEST